jgi:peptidoglycan hydrolase CwlO-like protein
MADINFQPLFEYLDEKFAKNDERFDQLEKRLDVLQTSVDNLAKQVQEFQQEMIVNRKRLEKLEAWAKHVSEKLGIPLPHDL